MGNEELRIGTRKRLTRKSGQPLIFFYVNKEGVIMEFTNEQLERIDEIENATFEFCKVLTEKEDLERSMDFIGEIAEAACDILVFKGVQDSISCAC